MGKISDFLSRVDLFGVPVTLNYRGKEKFTTMCGGCVSLILFVVFMGIFTYDMVTELNNPNFTANPQTLARTNKFDFKLEQSMIAAKLTSSQAAD